jgi:hypothetical protein
MELEIAANCCRPVSLGSEVLMPASFPTLLVEKTAAELRERERPHEGVHFEPSAPVERCGQLE